MAQAESSHAREGSVRGGSFWRWIAQGFGVLVIVLAAGSIGVALGRSSAPGPTLVVVPGPVVQESPGSDRMPSAGPAGSRLVVDSLWSAYPAVFTPANDLPDSATTASGYRLTRSGLDGSELAAGLATVLGVDGDVTRSATGWVVGPRDASAATLTVTDDASLSWALDDPVAAAASADGVFVDPGRARQTAEALLAAVGVDVGTVDWQVERYDNHLALIAWQMLEGVRTSLSWRVNLGREESVVSASGFSASLVEVPGYAVVGAATAVRRAGLPTWSLVGPAPLLTDPAAEPSSPPALGPATGPEGRPALQVGVSGIVVTDAVLGRAQFRQPDGELLVLPAYELTGDDGSRWTLIAVSGDYVDFVDQPFPAEVTPAS